MGWTRSREVNVALLSILTHTKPRNGYYLRAESFFNVAVFIDGGARFAPDLSLYGRPRRTDARR